MGSACCTESAGGTAKKSTKKTVKAKGKKQKISRNAPIIIEPVAPAGGVANPLKGKIPTREQGSRSGSHSLNPQSNSQNPPASTKLDLSHSDNGPEEGEPQRRLSNASSSQGSRKSQASVLRQITAAAAAKTAKILATVKDHDTLSTNKIAIIRGWVDMVDKTELLDPQDVNGFNRQVSAKEAAAERLGNQLMRQQSDRRFSMSAIVNKAEILKDDEAPVSDNVSMDAAGDVSSQTRSNQQLLSMVVPSTKPL